MNIEFIKHKLRNEKLQSLLIICIIFLFPAIALLNFFTGIQNSLLSYSYRLINLLNAFLIISIQCFALKRLCQSREIKLYSIFSNEKSLAFILLAAFWLFYLIRIFTDVYFFNISVTGKSSLNYYLLYTLGVTLIPSFAAPFFKIKDYSFFTKCLCHFLQCLNLIFILLYFVIIFSSDKPVFRYILAWKEFEYLDAISISVIGALLIVVSLFHHSSNFSLAIWSTAGAFLMATAASRGPYLSIIAVLSFAFITKKVNRKSILISVASLVSGFLIHYAFYKVFNELFIFGYPLSERFLNNEIDQSSIKRILLIKEGWLQLIKHPIAGSHFIVVSQGLYIHNLVLDVLLSTGIIGFLLLAPSFFIFFKKITLKNNLNLVHCLAFYFLMNAMTSGAIYNLNEFWFFFMYITFGNNMTNIDS